MITITIEVTVDNVGAHADITVTIPDDGGNYDDAENSDTGNPLGPIPSRPVLLTMECDQAFDDNNGNNDDAKTFEFNNTQTEINHFAAGCFEVKSPIRLCVQYTIDNGFVVRIL